MNFCIAGRCDGTSSTSTASWASRGAARAAGIRPGSDRRPMAPAAACGRPARRAWFRAAFRAASISAGFMVATMLVPTGVTAAAVGSSVIWNSVVAPSKIEAWPSTWKVNTGAPITTTRSCARSASDSCPGEACRKPANCGCRSGNEQRAENGLTQTAALVFSATRTIRSTASARSTPGPTTRAGCLRPASAATSAFIAAGIGTDLAADLAGLDRLAPDAPSRRSAPRRRSARRAAASPRNRRARSRPARPRPAPARRCI